MIGLRALGHGLSDLRAHPWRAGLSGLSLCIGVLAVVAIFTVGSVTAEVFIAAEEQHNGRLVTVQGELALPDLRPDTLRDALAAAAPVTGTGGAAVIMARPTSVTGVVHASQAETGAAYSRQPLVLVAGDLGKVRRLPLLAGRWFDPQTDVPIEVVVNQPGAFQWGAVGTQLAVLTDVRYPPVRTQVVGVIADGHGDAHVYVSLPALSHAVPGVLSDGGVEVLLHHPSAGLDTLHEVAVQMAAAAGGALPERVRRTDTVHHLLEQLESQQRAFFGVAVLALAISALGMLNIGLASVGERARELVIRRAVGATRVDITAQMLVSALLIGVFAAGVAIALAVVGVEWWVPQQIPAGSALEPPGLPWQAAGWGVVAAVATTLAGSLLPALVAARLDVADVLRD